MDEFATVDNWRQLGFGIDRAGTAPRTIGESDRMYVASLAPAVKAVQLETGGVNVEGFPMTSYQVNVLPAQITLPVVVSVYAPGGSEYHPRLYLTTSSPRGNRIGGIEFDWHWPDNPGSSVKFRVFVQHLTFTADQVGVYTIGLYDDPDTAQALQVFPLPVSRLNPLLGRSAEL